MKVGDQLVSSQIENPKAAWNSRLEILVVGEKGIKMKKVRDNSEFFLTFEALEKSFWKIYKDIPNFEI